MDPLAVCMKRLHLFKHAAVELFGQVRHFTNHEDSHGHPRGRRTTLHLAQPTTGRAAMPPLTHRCCARRRPLRRTGSCVPEPLSPGRGR